MLRAIALVESGQDRGGGLRPWPWTVHAHGRGHWFSTRAAAEAFLADVPPSEVGIDIGCFQINTRWHGAAFAGPAAMLDPEGTADHAARFLVSLRAALGDWDAAVGAYHSRRPEAAERYLGRFRAARASLPEDFRAAPDLRTPAPVATGPAGRRAAPVRHGGDPAGALTGGIPWH